MSLQAIWQSIVSVQTEAGGDAELVVLFLGDIAEFEVAVETLLFDCGYIEVQFDSIQKFEKNVGELAQLASQLTKDNRVVFKNR